MIEFHCSFAKHEKKMLREKLPLSTKIEAIAINHLLTCEYLLFMIEYTLY